MAEKDFITTLNKVGIRRAPELVSMSCEDVWVEGIKKFGKLKPDNDEISIREINTLIGPKWALWCLRTIEGKDKEIRLMACEIIESILPFYDEKYPNDKEVEETINTAKNYANGIIAGDELDKVKIKIQVKLSKLLPSSLRGAAEFENEPIRATITSNKGISEPMYIIAFLRSLIRLVTEDIKILRDRKITGDSSGDIIDLVYNKATECYINHYKNLHQNEDRSNIAELKVKAKEDFNKIVENILLKYI